MKYLNANVDKISLVNTINSMKEFCVNKFYVLNGIFEEIGLVLITDFFPFEDFLNS